MKLVSKPQLFCRIWVLFFFFAKKGSKKMERIEELSSEVLVLILRFFGVKEKLKLRHVSRLFKALIEREGQLWRRVEVGLDMPLKYVELVARISSPHLQTLKIKPIWKSLPSHKDKQLSLLLSNTWHAQMQEMLSLFRDPLPKLKNVKARGTALFLYSQRPTAMRSKGLGFLDCLSSLDYEECKKYGEREGGMQEVEKGLEVEWVSSQWKKMEELDVRGNLVRKEEMEKLAFMCNSLRQLKLGWSSEARWREEPLLSHFLKDVSFLTLFPCLTKITLDGLDGIPAGTLCQTFRKLRCLTHISVSYLSLAEEWFQAVCDNCSDTLVDLNIRACRSVTESGLLQVAARCKRMRVVNVSCLRAVTEQVVLSMSSNMKNLVHLDLCYCSSLVSLSTSATHQLLSAIFRAHDLVMAGFGGFKLTDELVEFMCEQCKNLEVIGIGGACQLTSRSLRAISKNCKNVRQIYAHKLNASISYDDFKKLIDECNKLVKLDIADCLGINHFERESLLTYFEKLVHKK